MPNLAAGIEPAILPDLLDLLKRMQQTPGDYGGIGLSPPQIHALRIRNLFGSKSQRWESNP